MKNSKQFVLPLVVFCFLAFSGCSKLQNGYDYQSSFYGTQVDMTVMDFMKSRTDIFSDMLAAIDYVGQDSAYKDVLEMYSSTGNTFLLLHNNALTNLEDVNSYWSLNPVMGPDPNDPSQMITMKGSAWSQYSRDTIANLLKYHVLKGTQTYSTLNSTPKWVDTYALSETNDSAKVYIYLENVREANLRLNNYTDVPTTYKGTTISWIDIAPRTPDLHATNGVIHVMNKWLFEPTRESIRNN